MPRVNVVVGFTPFHSFFAERLINDLDGESYCLFTKGWPDGKGKYKRLGFFIRRNRFLQRGSYLLSFVYFTLWVRWSLLMGKELHVYVPHPSNIYSNFLFFSKRVSSVNIYEDGLLNYYDADASRGRVGFGLRLFAFLCGASFRSYKGHLAGYDARTISSLYVSREEGVVSRGKVGLLVQLPLTSSSIDLVKGRVLFLDQDVSSFLSSGEREELILEMFKMYPPDKYQYFYKGHHDYQGLIEGMIPLQGWLVSLPAEVVMPELRPEIVVSFFSSALLNIVGSFPGVSCVALAAQYVKVSRDGVPGSLADIFSHGGVVCVSKSDP